MTQGGLHAAFALLVAWLNQIPVFGSSSINLKTTLRASAFLALNLGFDSLKWKYTSVARKQRIRNFIPHAAQERFLWVPVSLVSGIGEEIVFRAVLFGLLYGMTGHFWVAAIASAVFFALMHLAQGSLTNIVGLFFVALGLQWLVKISGGLYVAIAVHFLQNLINGLVYGALAKPVLDDGSPRCQAASSTEMAAAMQQSGSNCDWPTSPTQNADPADH